MKPKPCSYTRIPTAPSQVDMITEISRILSTLMPASRAKAGLEPTAVMAERLGIPHAGGLYMLVAQAKRSSELFTGIRITDSEIERIEKKLAAAMKNIVLIGMPG